MSIRIIIADDHPMIIGGLKNMLPVYPHVTLAGAYPDGESLLTGLQEGLPDVLLLDIQLPGKTGDELTPLILKKYPGLRILVLTNMNSSFYVHNMFRLGVSGYLLKNTDPEMVIRAIETVHRGEQFTDPALVEKLDEFTSRMKKEAALKPTLTPREQEILRLTVEGCTIQEISEKLFIGLRTVEYYRGNLFIKMDVRNMAGLIKKALELGLTD